MCSAFGGCLDPIACNYDPDASFDDGTCEFPEQYYDCDENCLNDIDVDGICDELECLDVFCQEFYECILGDCVCINDVDVDGICDENEDNCLDLTLLSINQINPDQFTVIVENNAWDNIFSYPGFILFNEFGDTIAMENVNFYGIAEQSVHILDIQDNIEITDNLNLELYTSFYDYLACQWNDVMISDNCELEPQSGDCEAAFLAYYFNQNNNQCEEFMWGGCYGVVPFWNLEDCQNACESVAIPETEFAREIIRQTDVLGRSVFGVQGFIIQLYNDGSVEKELILSK